MIQPIQSNSNISFAGTEASKASTNPYSAFQSTPKAVSDEVDTVVKSKAEETTLEEQPKKKLTLTEVKHKFLNFFKGFNNINDTAKGAIKGVAFGSLIAAGVGAVGKNIKDAEGKIAGTLTGIGKDLFAGIKNTVLFVPKLITKSPLENARSLVTLVPRFYTKYLKGHAGIAALATLTGVGVLAFNTIQGKIKANKKNADLDHKLNHGHVK